MSDKTSDSLTSGVISDNNPSLDLQSRDRRESQTVIMDEEVDIIRREVKQLKQRKIVSNGLRDAAVSTIIACVLQFAAFAFPTNNPFTLTWGTAVTLMILVAAVVVFFLSLALRDREIEEDDFEERKRNILQDLSRIDKKEMIKEPEYIYPAKPAKHWWERLFRRLCGIN